MAKTTEEIIIEVIVDDNLKNKIITFFSDNLNEKIFSNKDLKKLLKIKKSLGEKANLKITEMRVSILINMILCKAELIKLKEGPEELKDLAYHGWSPLEKR